MGLQVKKYIPIYQEQKTDKLYVEDSLRRIRDRFSRGYTVGRKLGLLCWNL